MRALCTLAAVLGIAAGSAGYAQAVEGQPVFASGQPVGNPAECPWLNSNLSIARRVSLIMHQMTLDDKIQMVEGQGTDKPYVFYMAGNTRLCMPPLGLEDGPQGVADALTGVTKFASNAALAATFSRRLAYRYGKAIAAEQVGKGTAVDLGPTVNIARDPRWGREFESLSEDPKLTAVLGAANIRGMQSEPLMAQVKHFVAYNQEINRNTPDDNVIISDRTLHEIYDPAFRTAIRDAKAASVMCAYSTVNGDYACQNKKQLTGVLRDQWDFSGFVTSDYAAIHDVSAAAAGTDMQQPFDTFFGAPLKSAVNGGTVPLAVLNTMVSRILTQMFRFHFFNHPPAGSTSATVTTERHQNLSTRVAAAGTVLLKNQQHLLPLSPSAEGGIAVIGPAASAQVTYGGGGSAHVIPSAQVTPLDGISSTVGSSNVSYAQGLPTDAQLTPIPADALSTPYSGTDFGGSFEATLTAPETGTYIIGFSNECNCYTASDLAINGQKLISNPSTPPVNTYSASIFLRKGDAYDLTLGGAGPSSNLVWATPSQIQPQIQQAVAAAQSARTAVVVVSDNTESEAADRPRLDLPSAQNRLISAVAQANPNTVVVVQAGEPIAMPWLNQVGSIVDTWYSGQTNGTALANVLFGKTNPGGHLPVTFPAQLADVPAAAPERFPGVDGKVQYSEGLLVGYRWYNAKNIKPMFPFGFGLSYTTFKYSNIQLSSYSVDGVTPIQVSAQVTNTGSVAGSDVAQLYLSMPEATGEPPRKLVDFQRVRLAPGQSRTVHFTIGPRDEWWWDTNGWNETEGTYKVYVGHSSAAADLGLSTNYQMAASIGDRQVRIRSPQTVKPGRPAFVAVSLGAGGSQTLQTVRLRLKAPGDWQVFPLGRRIKRNVGPERAVSELFAVLPPADAVAQNVVFYGTADLDPRACLRRPGGRRGGQCQGVRRHAGMTVTVDPSS